MQLSEVLHKLSKKYVLGAIEFYEKQSPNAWQDAHDKLEGALLLNRGFTDYENRMQPHYRDFLFTCERLLAAYKAMGSSTRVEPSIQDCFMIADENKVRVIHSLAENTCLVCGTVQGVKAATHPNYGSAIYCDRCIKVLA